MNTMLIFTMKTLIRIYILVSMSIGGKFKIQVELQLGLKLGF